MDQHDWPFKHPNPSQMIEILGCANSEAWMWAWVVVELVSVSSLPYPHSQVSSPALLWLDHPMAFFGSPTPMSPEPVLLLYCPIKVRSPLSEMLEPVRGWDSSPHLTPLELAYRCLHH